MLVKIMDKQELEKLYPSKSIRLVHHTDQTMLFQAHPFLFHYKVLNGEYISFCPPWALAAFLHLNGAAELYCMGVISQQTLRLKVIDQNKMDACIKYIHDMKSDPWIIQLYFKLLHTYRFNKLVSGLAL